MEGGVEESPLVDEAAVVDQLSVKLTQSLDVQALRPVLAVSIAEKLLREGVASKVALERIAEQVSGALAKELAQNDTGLRAM
eukprot:15419773-Alexandrium_andersonii.AAC.1